MVRRHTGGNGILALTGTLGENSPLEIYNIFHLIDPTIFESLGIDDPEQFIDRYLDIDVLAVTDVTGAAEIASAVVGFKNLREMRDILFRWGSFVSARQAGLRLPKARECLAEVDLSATQAARYEDLRQDASKALEKGSTGTAFAAISRMRLVSLHPELEEGYTWTTANGGLARKKVTHEALEHWQARGWRRSLHVLESKMKAAEGIERQQLQSQYATLAAKERKADEVSVQKLLPPPTSMAAPKLLAVVDRVLATKDCAHIVFVQFTAIHFWLREVLVEAGVERSRIAVINAMEGDIDKVAKAVNGTDDEPPKVDIVIANSKAYRGANFQRRTCAIHNLDLPWTPADLEQRRGRGERQGNLQPVIQIWYYFSRRSFDGFLFSLLVGKAGWQDKLYRSDDDRSTNPQMQLNLDPTQLRRLTAASEAEAEAIEQTLREQAQQRQTAAARKNALAHMQSAITKFAAARSATDSM
ncbi:MAG: hypothetical protein KC636_40190, partial [Myxococcales bacterium]|nr:hypothetical protein [Myxococcales bacterium]